MPMIRCSAGNVSVACRVAMDRLDAIRVQIVVDNDLLRSKLDSAGFWSSLYHIWRTPRGFMYDGRAVDLFHVFHGRWADAVEKAKRLNAVSRVSNAATDGIVYLDYDDLDALGWQI